MRLGVIGFGQGGGRVVDRLLKQDVESSGANIVQGVAAVNTAKSDLQGLEYVPEDRQILIGKGHGVGADNEQGAKVTHDYLQEVMDGINDFTTKIDAYLVVSALGGGTGSGGAPVVIRELQKMYDEPIYSLSILPAEDEGSLYSRNAARSFQTVVDEADNVILFDNNSWVQSGESIKDQNDRMNAELVKRIHMLFSAGEIKEGQEVGESIVDASEIMNTLGENGISTIGYAEAELSPEERPNSGGLLDRFRGGNDDDPYDDPDKTRRIKSLCKKAARGRLTHPAQLDGIERALVVTYGPPSLLSRKGIQESRRWIEDQTGTMEVRGGDYPDSSSDKLACIVLFSGVTQSDRIKELQRIAIEAQDTIDKIQEESDENLDDLLQQGVEDDEDIEGLF